MFCNKVSHQLQLAGFLGLVLRHRLRVHEDQGAQEMTHPAAHNEIGKRTFLRRRLKKLFKPTHYGNYSLYSTSCN